MPKSEILIKGTIELISTALHPDNPRVHSIEPEGDVIKTALSLLHAGWCELPSYNVANNLLIGGHGRVLACEFLMQQTKEWFGSEWQKYQQVNPETSSDVKERFAAGYWLKVPLRPSELDDRLHKTMIVRLNNAEARGTSSDRLKAALLERLKPQAQELAMPDPARRSSFLAKFGEKKAEAEASVTAEEKQEAIELAQSIERGLQSVTAKFEEIQASAADASGDEPEVEEEPDVQEGGANFNADPAPDKKKQVLYPIAVILSDRRYRQFEQWKADQGLTSDQAAFLKGHEIFREAKNG